MRRVIVGHDEDDIGTTGASGLSEPARGQKGDGDEEARG
jgi:hypothetical protein